jgi:hypothetical protein
MKNLRVKRKEASGIFENVIISAKDIANMEVQWYSFVSISATTLLRF